jgi:hypothetical protein
MTQTGWFHRSRLGRGNGELQWVSADVSSNRTLPPDLIDPPQSLCVTVDSPVPPGSYPVGEVRGRGPAGLDDFVGVASFTVITGDRSYRVFGTGGRLDVGVVRFGQQDLGWDGRVIRTWLITATPNGIVAVPDPDRPVALGGTSPAGTEQGAGEDSSTGSGSANAAPCKQPARQQPPRKECHDQHHQY